jgi:hypothetical protein
MARELIRSALLSLIVIGAGGALLTYDAVRAGAASHGAGVTGAIHSQAIGGDAGTSTVLTRMP